MVNRDIFKGCPFGGTSSISDAVSLEVKVESVEIGIYVVAYCTIKSQ